MHLWHILYFILDISNNKILKCLLLSCTGDVRSSKFVVLFFSSHRSGRRIRKTRKYDIITTPAERVEMAPLNEENDDEDDSTLFDIKYRFLKWDQHSSPCGTKHTWFSLLSCSKTPEDVPLLQGCFSSMQCWHWGSPFRHFNCLLTHNHFLKGRRSPVYLHSDIFPGACVHENFRSNLAEWLDFSLSCCRWTWHGRLQRFHQTTPVLSRTHRLQILLVHCFYLFKLLL